MTATPSPETPLRSTFVDDEAMMELVEIYVDEISNRISSLKDCWQQGDAEGIQRLAHQLKGASAGYGFAPVGEAAGTLEGILRDQAAPDLESCKSEFEQLIDLCSRVSL